jgi:hypothetical protein
VSRRLHPEALARIEEAVRECIDGARPPLDDPDEEAATVAAMNADGFEIDVETLRSWREDYKPWDTDDEWRDCLVSGLVHRVDYDVLRIPGPRSWRRWKATRKAVHWLTMLGVLCGSAYCNDWSGGHIEHISFSRRGHPPYYILWWQRGKWRCLLRYRHWPTRHTVVFDLCGKCAPCPDCGSFGPLEHGCAGVSSEVKP